MARTIEQTVTFPQSPERLYRIYLSAREHAAACGWGRARITPRIGGGRLEMIHANVPDPYVKSIAGGWRLYYWKPWKAYLKKTRRR